MFDENNIKFLERHFANELTNLEQVEFNKLMSNNSNFEELVEYFEDFMLGMEDFGDKAIILELKSLEKVIQEEETKTSKVMTSSLPNLLKGFLEKTGYTLEQLATLFLPVPTYQPLLAYTHRGNGIPLEKQKPEEEWDLADSDIELRFKKPTPMDLSLVIENNQRKIVWATTVLKSSTKFTLSLENTGINAPGRYYIKLSEGKETAILEFFVRKDWRR